MRGRSASPSTASSRPRPPPGRARTSGGIEELLGTLAAGDRLVVSELSRLGRSLGQVIQIVDELVKRKVRFVGDQGSDPLRGEAGHADQGDDRPVRAVRRGREGPDLGADQGRAGGRAGQGSLARPPQGLAGNSPSSTARRRRSGCCWRRRSPRHRSPRSWASPAPPSITSSGPGSSTRRLQKAKRGGAVLKGYFTAIWAVP